MKRERLCMVYVTDHLDGHKMHSFVWFEGAPTVSCLQWADQWTDPAYPFSMMLDVLHAAFKRGNVVTFEEISL